jgi:hypothetical protein
MKTREHRERHHGEEPLEEIRHQAYLLWQQEGCPVGRELDHWLAAKEIVRHHTHRPPPIDEEREAAIRPTEQLVEQT